MKDILNLYSANGTGMSEHSTASWSMWQSITFPAAPVGTDSTFKPPKIKLKVNMSEST